MNVNDGRYVQLDTYLEPEEQLRTAAALLGCGARDVVRVEGTPEQVEALSARVRLGADVKDRRRRRSKAQRASRKRNR